MNTEQIDGFCLHLKGVQRDYKTEWEAFRYLVGGKMFLMHGHNKEGLEIYTLKGVPEANRACRGQYPEILPGYYMNKEHWISVPVGLRLPDGVLQALVQNAYELVLGSLPKKVQVSLS